MSNTTLLPQHQMTGHLMGMDGSIAIRGGFMPPTIPNGGFIAGGGIYAPNSIEMGNLQRGETGKDGVNPSDNFGRGFTPELTEALDSIKRGDYSGNVAEVLGQMAGELSDLQRGVTSAMTAFPVRENLESPAATLIPTDTPVRNMLARVPGAGAATAWRQLTSLGGGWGTSYDQPGGGSATRTFYAETGAPVEHTSVYAAKSLGYKLLGTLGSVTGFAQAAGANFQDQMATERKNQMQNLMLNEELSLIYGDSASTAAPWGDGSAALAFDGLMKLVTTANGTPSAQVATSVGDLTTAHIDAQLTRLWKQGGRDLFILMNAQETVSLSTILQATGSVQRLQISDAGNATLGFRVAKYIHPVSGLAVDLYTSLFMAAGEMFFGSRKLPDGSNSAEVEVLPQVPVQTAPEKPQQIQGYVVTDLARSLTQPDVHPFMISCYEVLKLKSAIHFAKSTGVLPA